MHGIDVLEHRQGLGNLGDAVALVVEQDHLEVAGLVLVGQQVVHQHLVVGGVGIDEDDLPAGLVGGPGLGRFRGIRKQLLQAGGARRRGGVDAQLLGQHALQAVGEQHPGLHGLDDGGLLEIFFLH